MRIVPEWRDRFPKMGLDGEYVGDGYPLCSDIPSKHFLKKGALYRLLGSSHTSIVLSDPIEWRDDPFRVDFLVAESSNLYEKLCKRGSNGVCRFQSKVELDDDVPCFEDECLIDTVRTVRINEVYYEYVRPACTHLAFFSDGKTVVHQRENSVMCADPRVPDAGPTCCEIDEWEADWSDQFYGERTTYATALNRCTDSQQLCNWEKRPWCEEDDPMVGLKCYSDMFFWTTTSCRQRVLIDSQSRVAVVHTSDAEEDIVSWVSAQTKTFFRVDWEGDVTWIFTNCEVVDSCERVEDHCLCEVQIQERRVFDDESPSDQEILDSLHIGALDRLQGGGTARTFEVIGSDGKTSLRKNMVSIVYVEGTETSFRNPPHFMSLADGEKRDAEYETEATIDHYFFHPNVAPFLSIRLSQRFGISNPSPGLITRMSEAFRSGSFVVGDFSFGGGSYGDLGATIASLLLDDEARDVKLEADASFGSLKEPLLKVVGLMRSLEFELGEGYSFAEFGERFPDMTGQSAYEVKSVFSFFLPEYTPTGPIQKAGIVSPESQLLTGPKIIDSVNGLLSMIQWGLSDCFGGFGLETDCRWIDDYHVDDVDEIRSLGSGHLTRTPSGASAVEVIDELSVLMTAGRLSPESKSSLAAIIEGEINPTAAFVHAQQLIALSPEFHATGQVHRTGNERPAPPIVEPGETQPYRAVVYMLLDGGVDSFNMLVPHTCSSRNGKNLREQYDSLRTTIAMTDDERTRIIAATGQPCSEFAVHQDLPVIERLYNDGDLSFFANVGVLDEPITKTDYFRTTELFGHNTMQKAAQRIDPWGLSAGTGILGRLSDKLKDKGFPTQPITIDDATIATVGLPGSAVPPIILSEWGSNNKFHPKPQGEGFNATEYLAGIIGETDLHSSSFGETWSQYFQQAYADSNLLVDALSDTVLTMEYDDETENDENEYLGKIAAISRILQ